MELEGRLWEALQQLLHTAQKCLGSYSQHVSGITRSIHDSVSRPTKQSGFHRCCCESNERKITSPKHSTRQSLSPARAPILARDTNCSMYLIQHPQGVGPAVAQ